MGEDWTDGVRERLALLAQLDPGRDAFGAATHGYMVSKAMTGKALATFETKLGVTLPDAYRAFVTRVGAGGAGPVYGLVPPSARSLSALPRPKAKKGSPKRVPDPSRTFPFSHPDGGDALAEGACLHDGCLFLADEGCGYFHVLVVTGARRGAVWGDYQEADEGLRELAPTFADYYLRWLDEALRACLAGAAKAALDAGARSPHDALIRAHADDVATTDSARDHLDATYLSVYLNRLDAARDHLAQATALAPTASEVKAARYIVWADDLARARAADPDPALATHAQAFVRHAFLSNPTVGADILDAVVARGLEHLDDAEAFIDLDLAARSPALPAARRHALALHDGHPLSPWLARAAILSYALDAATLRRLATAPSPVVRQAVALDARAAGDVLAALASDADHPVRLAVAMNPSTPSDALLALALHGDDDLAWELSVNPSLSLDAVHALIARWGEPGPIGNIGRRRWDGLPEATRAWLVLHPRWSARYREPEQKLGTDDDVLPPPDVSAAAVMAPERAARPWYRHVGYPVPLLPEDPLALDDLAALSLARHPWAPPAVLATLAEHRYIYVQAALAERDTLPLAALSAFATHRDAHTVHYAAANPRFPVDLLPKVAAHADAFAREGAALHPDAPRALLETLAHDPEEYPRRGVARNPKTPPDLLELLARDPLEDVRWWLVENPALPEAALHVLEDDPSDKVRRAAAWRRMRDALQGKSRLTRDR